MARSHLCRINTPYFGSSRTRSGVPRCGSARLAHLRCMKTTRTPTTLRTTRRAISPPSSPTSLASDDGVVVTGVFEAALSIQELAARLHVSAQTIYDLRSQGRGPVGFRVGRHLRFRPCEIDAWLARLEGEDFERHPGGEAR